MKHFNKKFFYIYKCFLMLPCLLTLSSCGVFFGSSAAPPKHYIIQTSITPKKIFSICKKKKSLFIYSTTNSPLYDSNKMIYIKNNNQLGYYSRHAWAIAPAAMINKEMIKSIQQSQLYKNVIIAPFSGLIDQRLSSQLLDFQQNWLNNKESVFQISLAVQLISAQNNQIIASKIFTANIPVFPSTPEGGANAANIALMKVLSQLNIFLQKNYC